MKKLLSIIFISLCFFACSKGEDGNNNYDSYIIVSEYSDCQYRLKLNNDNSLTIEQLKDFDEITDSYTTTNNPPKTMTVSPGYGQPEYEHKVSGHIASAIEFNNKIVILREFKLELVISSEQSTMQYIDILDKASGNIHSKEFKVDNSNYRFKIGRWSNDSYIYKDVIFDLNGNVRQKDAYTYYYQTSWLFLKDRAAYIGDNPFFVDNNKSIGIAFEGGSMQLNENFNINSLYVENMYVRSWRKDGFNWVLRIRDYYPLEQTDVPRFNYVSADISENVLTIILNKVEKSGVINKVEIKVDIANGDFISDPNLP